MKDRINHALDQSTAWSSIDERSKAVPVDRRHVAMATASRRAGGWRRDGERPISARGSY
jgi:hypothetical protein